MEDQSTDWSCYEHIPGQDSAYIFVHLTDTPGTDKACFVAAVGTSLEDTNVLIY